jgi:hypothetical protein
VLPFLLNSHWAWFALGLVALFLGLKRGWRGNTAPLALALGVLFVGDLAGNLMARHSVNNLWLDRLELAVVSGLNLNFLGVRPRLRHWTTLALALLASALAYPADKFGLVVPLGVLGVTAWGLADNMRGRLLGTCSQPVWLFTGALAWAWTLVLRVFADHAALMTKGEFAAYWALTASWGLAAMTMVTYGVWASSHRAD